MRRRIGPFLLYGFAVYGVFLFVGGALLTPGLIVPFSKFWWQSRDPTSPASVAGPDAASTAIVTVKFGTVTLHVPRRYLVGMSVGPHYCPSGRGVCGHDFFPHLAFVYPSLTPPTVTLAAKLKRLPSDQPSDVVILILLSQEEPGRVAAFLSKPTQMKDAPFGLTSVFGWGMAADLGTADALIIDSGVKGFCHEDRYFFSNVHAHLEFDCRLVPEWKSLNLGISSVLNTFRGDS